MPRRTVRTAAAAVAVLLFATRTPAAQAPPIDPARAKQIDAVFVEWDHRESPGCALALFHGGRIVYEKGYGMADVEHDVAIAPETIFYVGSVSKQFTAMAAALAIAQQRLALDDPVRKYLPELPAYADAITIRHLIHHTSGLRDVNTLLSIAGRRGDEAFDNLEVLRIVARQRALNFTPGTEYLYSNSGYAALALTVERATGTPFAEYADAQIFKPLGMRATHFGVDLSRIVRQRAYAYERGDDGALRLDTPYNERAGAGGVWTSVQDLLKWDENFYSGSVGGKAILGQVQTPGRLNDGTALDYAWGLRISAYRGLPTVEHSGSLGGYRAHLVRFPGEHFSIACLCNIPINPGGLSERVADIYLGSRFKEPPPRSRTTSESAASPGPAAVPLAAKEQSVDPYAGVFVSDELETTFTFAVRSGQFVLRRGVRPEELTLEPTGVGTFRSGALIMRFAAVAGGRADGLVLDSGRVRGIQFSRQTTATTSNVPR